MARWARARKAAEVKPVETLPPVERQRCPICLEDGDSQWVARMDDNTGDGIRGVVLLTYIAASFTRSVRLDRNLDL